MNKFKSILFLILPVLLVILLSYYLQGLVLSNQEEFTDWLSRFGPYILVVYVILQALTIIIAPIGGFFLITALISLFGPGFALTLGYFASTPIYLINFYLARKFGRPLVEKIIGKTALDNIDHYVQDAGLTTLVILRLFQGGNFDYLSYGLGLTKVPFKTFALVNFLVGIPAQLIFYFILTSFESLTAGILFSYLYTIILTGLSIYIHHLYRKK